MQVQARLQELLAEAHLLQGSDGKGTSPKRLACHVMLLRELLKVVAFGPLQAGINSPNNHSRHRCTAGTLWYSFVCFAGVSKVLLILMMLCSSREMWHHYEILEILAKCRLRAYRIS